MKVIYRQAVQGHAVPDRVLEARGPFGRYEPPMTDQEYDPDSFPPGATAQNEMREVVFYECRLCQDVLRETELDTHQCEE